jgi:diacylglycerol kinase (ATP)
MADLPVAQPGSLGRLVRSFGYAFRGVCFVLATQANARIHAGVSVVVVALGFFLGLSQLEWCAVIAAIGLVWTAEALNTVFETLIDLVSPEHHPLAGRVKDVAAGAVLCATVTSAILGAMIFIPKLLFRLGF